MTSSPKPLIRLSFSIAVLCLLTCGTYLVAIAVTGLMSRPRSAELAVVLGNTVTANGEPSGRLRARLDVAASLFRAGLVHRIMVSGGVEQPGNRDEAAVMASYLKGHGVPAGAVVQDPAGVNTLATARHAAASARDGRVIVVTQWFHLPRAMLAMSSCGVRNVSGAWPRWFELRDAYSLMREAVALLVYALRPGRCAADATSPVGSPQAPP